MDRAGANEQYYFYCFLVEILIKLETEKLILKLILGLDYLICGSYTVVLRYHVRTRVSGGEGGKVREGG